MMATIFLFCCPSMSMASVPSDFNRSVTINDWYNLGTQKKITVWDEYIYDPKNMPNGYRVANDFYISCLSENNSAYGACPVYPSWWSGTKDVLLTFVEKRSNLKHVAAIQGYSVAPGCDLRRGFASSPTTCLTGGVKINAYISPSELKKFPIGGIWAAHLKMRVGEWHGGNGAETAGWPGFMNVYWTADFTLKITDDNNIRIWLPEFHGSEANVIMPITPAYWALNKPGQVTAEKIIDACLYDGYNSNSNTFQVSFNSSNVDATSRDFILQNTSEPGGSFLHYQVLVSHPGSSDPVRVVNPGESLVYSGMDTSVIRQVMMPGLQEPVACVPWSIRLKLKPFNLSKQQAGHYSGVLNLTFTPSL